MREAGLVFHEQALNDQTVAAELARKEAEAARVGAQEAKAAAEGETVAAELARKEAEAARMGAQEAMAAAEGAQTESRLETLSSGGTITPKGIAHTETVTLFV